MTALLQAPIAYEVIRSKRSTADIIIERDGRILIRAPEWVEDEQIEQIVETKKYWIFQSLAEWRDLNASRVLREFRNGEGFLYLGRSYRLQLVADQREPLVLVDGRFHLRRDCIEQGDIGAAKQAFAQFYVARGLERIPERIERLAPKLGVSARSVEVRDVGYRWATCSAAGDLAFHWKCLMAPLAIVDYIVVHELCHLRHRDHTEVFWNDVDKVVPDYLERRDWLRRHGAALDV